MSTAWTIGHSTRPLDEFLALLREHRIEALADVRRFPASRKHPQYNAAPLESALRENDIRYLGLTSLGGRRPARKDSHNTAWRNESFRGYADYMETPEFAAAFSSLIESLEEKRTAIMCAEALWWRCHRSLLSDALKARGWSVCHILGPGESKAHPYTPAATLVDGKLSYGPRQLEIGV